MLIKLTKCIFCPGKKPNTMVKYSWDGLNEYYKATQEKHFDAYLAEEFTYKRFWYENAKLLHWKIRYQGTKYRPKIKGCWKQLAALGIASDEYCEFSVSLPKEAVNEIVENHEL